ncbi:MAG: CDP-alcohol phosphatidyltransferase family protein [Streptosporangiales bacterium]|nr:CDP-alcohol phosphatidyltransferase family protein [Streptosporangiales bacterium]
MLRVLRPGLARALIPLGRVLARTGISPNVLTMAGTVGVAGGALGFYPRGELFVGTLVVTFFVFSDMLDGALARARGSVGPWGAFLDSTMDRIGDAAIFGGLVLWFAGGGDDALLAALALYCLVAGGIVSYAKARAEGLGFACNVGIAERTERLLLILVATGLHGLGVPYALPVGLWLLAVGATVTVAQRFVVVWRQAGQVDSGGPGPAGRAGR